MDDLDQDLLRTFPQGHCTWTEIVNSLKGLPNRQDNLPPLAKIYNAVDRLKKAGLVEGIGADETRRLYLTVAGVERQKEILAPAGAE